MVMAQGTVSVADNETATGSGLAKEFYDADLATRVLPAVPSLGQTTVPFSADRPCIQADIDKVKVARLVLKREAARLANAYAVVIPHITTNGNAKVFVGGLQHTPNPNNPDTATTAPVAPVFLPLE